MNRLAIILGLAVGVLIGIAYALEDHPLPQGGAFYEGTVHEAARATLAAQLRAEMAAQVDTNTTTTTTLYTPRRVGDILVGSESSGTNGVWISKGTTTNDWVMVRP